MFSLQDMIPIQNQVKSSITVVCTKAATSIGALEKGTEVHVKIEEMGRLKRNQVVGNV